MKSRQDRKFIFNPGPAALPQEVINSIEKELYNWQGTGQAVFEISHRTKEVMAMLQAIKANLRELLCVPDNFSILFMHGGARAQFAAVPLNLLKTGDKAKYCITGYWSEKAYDEAVKVMHNLGISIEKQHIQKQNLQDLSASVTLEGNDYAYLHFTDNESIEGIELSDYPADRVVVVDMTSSLLAKEIDFSKVDLVYAAMQKNLGIAGSTVVIIKDELLKDELLNRGQNIPSVLEYTTLKASDSLYNTPNVFCWYVCHLMLNWVKQQGGVAYFNNRRAKWARQFYSLIDSSELYLNDVPAAFRSTINIPVRFTNPVLVDKFLVEAKAFTGLQGHNAYGGIRISLYTGTTEESVAALLKFMQEFAGD